MTDWSSGDVTVNGVRLHYHRTGNGDRPPLVLLHGFSDAGLCWSRVARDLESAFDVVMPDARGHGASERAGSSFDPSLRAADAAGVIEALGLGGAIVGGHSMGAATAAEIATGRPELVGRLVLEDPPWRDATGAPDRGRWDYLRRCQEMPPEDVPAYGRELHPTWDEAEIGPWAAAKLAFDLALLDARAMGSPRPWRSVAAGIRCPALLVTADVELGAIVTADAAAEAARRGGVRIEHIAGAGHNIRRERYDRYIEALRAFVA
jgi:pimeloyl-ACP methyl ester carboxylesterase